MEYPYKIAKNAHKDIAKHYAKLQSLSMNYHKKTFADWRNSQGFLGEVILADMLKCLPTWRTLKDESTKLELTNDGGYDIVYNDITIDVKTLAIKNFNAIDKLHIFKNLQHTSDILVAMGVDENEIIKEYNLNCIKYVSKVYCIGWIESKFFKKHSFNTSKFPLTLLNPISSLICDNKCNI